MIKPKTGSLLALRIVFALLLFYLLTSMQPSEYKGSTQVNSSHNNFEQKEENTAAHGTLANLVEQITRLENKQHELTRQIQELRTAQHVQTTPVYDAQSYNNQTPVSTEFWRSPLEDHRTTNPISTYKTAFEQESDDSKWQLAVEAAITATLEELEVADTLLDQIDCRQTACRLEFIHSDGKGSESFIETVLPAEPFTTEFYSESDENADGSRTTLVFIARPTHRPN